jgi:predicted PurR-regulated permease PerM
VAELSHFDFERGIVMEGKAKFIFPVVMAFFMALLMTAVVTYMNLGFSPNYISQWMKALAIAWPLSSVAAFAAVPLGQKITSIIVRLIDGH